MRVMQCKAQALMCSSDVTMVFEMCSISVTVVLQRCYSGFSSPAWPDGFPEHSTAHTHTHTHKHTHLHGQTGFPRTQAHHLPLRRQELLFRRDILGCYIASRSIVGWSRGMGEGEGGGGWGGEHLHSIQGRVCLVMLCELGEFLHLRGVAGEIEDSVRTVTE
jgi:hypothetical protein